MSTTRCRTGFLALISLILGICLLTGSVNGPDLMRPRVVATASFTIKIGGAPTPTWAIRRQDLSAKANESNEVTVAPESTPNTGSLVSEAPNTTVAPNNTYAPSNLSTPTTEAPITSVPGTPDWEKPLFFPQLPHGEFAADNLAESDCMKKIRSWIRRNDHWESEPIGWSEKNFIIAELIYTDGNGNIWTQCIKDVRRRGEDIKALVMRAARTLRKPTIFLLNLNDVDLWMITSSSGSVKRRSELLEMLDQCPHLFLLHWNPSINVSTGRLLGPRTVPIPDFHRSSDILWDPRPAKNPANDGKVVYRGATLGFWFDGDYRKHERYIVVEALQWESWANVAFNTHTQKVDPALAPWIREGLSVQDMSSYSAVLDVDGNANSWEGLRWKLGMGNAVFKAQSTTGFIQWYYPHLVNNLHLYVFDPREDPKVWKQEMQAILNTSVPLEERRSTKLADAGRAFAKKHLTMKAMDNYLSSTIQSVYELYSPDCAFDPKDSKHTRCWEKRDWRIQGTERMKLQ